MASLAPRFQQVSEYMFATCASDEIFHTLWPLTGVGLWAAGWASLVLKVGGKSNRRLFCPRPLCCAVQNKCQEAVPDGR